MIEDKAKRLVGVTDDASLPARLADRLGVGDDLIDSLTTSSIGIALSPTARQLSKSWRIYSANSGAINLNLRVAG
jgi:hypothetical protein